MLHLKSDAKMFIYKFAAASLYKSQNVHDGHLMFVTCDHNGKEIEFIAMVVDLAYSNKLGKWIDLFQFVNELLKV